MSIQQLPATGTTSTTATTGTTGDELELEQPADQPEPVPADADDRAPEPEPDEPEQLSDPMSFVTELAQFTSVEQETDTAQSTATIASGQTTCVGGRTARSQRQLHRPDHRRHRHRHGAERRHHLFGPDPDDQRYVRDQSLERHRGLVSSVLPNPALVAPGLTGCPVQTPATPASGPRARRRRPGRRSRSCCRSRRARRTSRGTRSSASSSAGSHLDQPTLGRLTDGVQRAAGKGSRDSVVFVDGTAYVVSVKNNTVITAVPSEHMHQHVFTNIDSAVIA